MLNVDNLRITRSMTLLIDGAGHLCVLTRIDDIKGRDGIGELGPVSIRTTAWSWGLKGRLSEWSTRWGYRWSILTF